MVPDYRLRLAGSPGLPTTGARIAHDIHETSVMLSEMHQETQKSRDVIRN